MFCLLWLRDRELDFLLRASRRRSPPRFCDLDLDFLLDMDLESVLHVDLDGPLDVDLEYVLDEDLDFLLVRLGLRDRERDPCLCRL